MSSILSAQNLQTFRRRNIGRRCPPSFVAPAAGRPRPPPPPKLLRPFIAPSPASLQTDRRAPLHSHRAVLHPADGPAADRARRAGAATSRCAWCATVRPPVVPRPRGLSGGG